MKRYRFRLSVVMLLAALIVSTAVQAESYEASTMRLLQYEGTVEILNDAGDSRFVMENVRFDSGETLKTGADGSASVSLDSSKIVSLDADTIVKFAEDSGHMKLTLTEGIMLLDVREKLDENESLDIQTATMTVGIRGTIVLFKRVPEAKLKVPEHKGTRVPENSLTVDVQNLKLVTDAEESVQKRTVLDENGATEVLVLAGVVDVTYQMEDVKRQVSVSAGEKAVIYNNRNEHRGFVPVIDMICKPDLEGYFSDLYHKDAELRKRIENDSPEISKLMEGLGKNTDQVADDLNDSESVQGEKEKTKDQSFSADGDWIYDGEVNLVAQSASKLYDGTPLTRSADALVSGLPEYFKANIDISGSQQDVGTSPNLIVGYSILNQNNEDVKNHFTNLNLIDGMLTVVPTQLTVWTEGAEKVYDGTPLTNANAELRSSPGELTEGQKSVTSAGAGTVIRTGTDSSDVPAWRNSSLVVTNALEKEVLYGTSGVIWVHATNPVTYETKNIELHAGERLEIILHNNTPEDSIEFSVTAITEEEIPDEVLRLYAENDSLLKQACADTGWKAETIRDRIKELKTESQTLVDKSGLKISKENQDKLMVDSTDVRLNVDSDVTNYNDRTISSEEAHFAPVYVPSTITLTATGSQTDVGESPNTVSVNWGNENSNNYEVSEDLGVLKVTPAELTITTGSASKPYDGTALTNTEAAITGLVEGETATVTATGTIISAGTAVNTYSIDWENADPANYTIVEKLGTLEILERSDEITITAGSAEKVYDGTPLTVDQATVSGLPEGYSCSYRLSGSQKDAGTGSSTVSEYTILDAYGNDVTGVFENVKLVSGTLTVTRTDLEITTGSAIKKYDGSALTSSEANVTGLAQGDTLKVITTGSITIPGKAKNTYTLDWGDTIADNYSITENVGELEVTINDNEIRVTVGTIEKEYDGEPLYAEEETGEEETSQTDADEAAKVNTDEATDLAGNSDYAPVGSSGYIPVEVTVTGLPDGFNYLYTLAGSQTEPGSSEIKLVDFSIYNSSGNNVTKYFSCITPVNGTVRVNPRRLFVSSASASKPYDGAVLKGDAFTVQGLLGNDKIEVLGTAEITNVGTVSNTFKIDWKQTDLTKYEVIETLGTLEIYPNSSEITMQPVDVTKPYDGTALTSDTVNASGLGYIDGFKIVCKTGGSQTSAGTSENIITD